MHGLHVASIFIIAAILGTEECGALSIGKLDLGSVVASGAKEVEDKIQSGLKYVEKKLDNWFQQRQLTDVSDNTVTEKNPENGQGKDIIKGALRCQANQTIANGRCHDTMPQDPDVDDA